MLEEREGRSTQAGGGPAGCPEGPPSGVVEGSRGQERNKMPVSGRGLPAECKTPARPRPGQGDPFPPGPTAGAGLGGAPGGDRRRFAVSVTVLLGTTDTASLAGSVRQALHLLWQCRGG